MATTSDGQTVPPGLDEILASITLDDVRAFERASEFTEGSDQEREA